MHGLERPEPTKEEWVLQLGLTETDHLRSIVFKEIVYDLLFRLLVETSDIEGDEFELLPVGFHFREISLDPRSVFVGECISPVFSVSCSTPTNSLIFLLGLLVPRCYLFLCTFGGSIPTVTTSFMLCLLLLLSQLRSIWQLRDCFFRLPVLLLSSPMMSLSCFVDSFSGVLHSSPILFGPCNLFCDSRMLAVLVWASR